MIEPKVYKDPETGEEKRTGPAVFNADEERVTGLFESEEAAEDYRKNMIHVDKDMDHLGEGEIFI